MNHHIGFRVEWSNKIGYGHIFRCSALANVLEKKGYEPVFFTSSKENIISNLKIVDIKNANSSIAQAMKDRRIDLVINDILDTDFHYMKQLAENAIKSVNLDDTGEAASLASINIMALRNPKMYGSNTITGPQFLILREQFAQLRSGGFRRSLSRDIHNVLILASGSEPPHTIQKCVRSISAYDDSITTTIVCNDASRLGISTLTRGNLKVIENADANTIINIMLQADVGITGCGIGAYEMACTGLPVITICKSRFESSENQIGKYGFAIQAGQADSVRSEDIHRALTFLYSSDNRKVLSEKGYNTVDGVGLNRVVQIIEGLLHG
jgi:spore coat polysaccharide biosynthesis predicted glycosyltransferase SpsG